MADSLNVALWQGTTSAAGLVQIALITHILGLTEYGRFALVVALVTLVGGFLMLRVEIPATTRGAHYLDRDARTAVGIFQITYLLDVSTGLVGFAVVGALVLVFDPQAVGAAGVEVVLIYALILVTRPLDRSANVVLRLLDRFKAIVLLTAVTELGRLALVLAALLVYKSLVAVAAAVVIGQIVLGVVKAVAANRAFGERLDGASLTHPAMRGIAKDERRRVIRTAFHTNIVSYNVVAQQQVPTLLLGAIIGATEAGVYRLGMAVATIVGQASDAARVALLPRMSRLWSGGRMLELRQLVRHVTAITVPLAAVVFVLLVVLREPILRALGGGGPELAAAATVLVLGAAGQALQAAVFWRAAVLFVANRSATVAGVTLVGAGVQVGCLLALIPPLEAPGAGLAFLASALVVNVTLAVIAARTLRRDAPRGEPVALPP